MSNFLKTVSEPLDNRNHSDKKTNFLVVLYIYSPALVIPLGFALFVDPIFWLVLLAFMIIALVDYYIFVRILGKFAMSTFLKTIFQPLHNRYYSDKKTSFLFHLYFYLPALFISLGAAFVDPVFWWVLLAIMVIAVVDYIVFDWIRDKITWKIFWSRFYPEKKYKHSAEHNAIKEYEKNPSEENHAAIKKYMQK